MRERFLFAWVMRKDADVLDALLSQYRSDPTARAALSKRVEDERRRAAASARAAREAPRHEDRNSLLARLQLEHGAAHRRRRDDGGADDAVRGKAAMS